VGAVDGLHPWYVELFELLIFVFLQLRTLRWA